jgi:hypothetical protein
MVKKKKFTEIELFYIEGNCLSKSLDEISKILNIDQKEIEDIYLKAKKRNSDKFQRYSGTTCMTESQSMVSSKKSSNIDEKNIHRL